MFKTLGKKSLATSDRAWWGLGIGSIPVVGNTTSSFLSYKLAKDFSKHPENFGNGEPDGVIASEAANSACTGGALIPMLVLGIPGDPPVAVMMGGDFLGYIAGRPIALGVLTLCVIVFLLPLAQNLHLRRTKLRSERAKGSNHKTA